MAGFLHAFSRCAIIHRMLSRRSWLASTAAALTATTAKSATLPRGAVILFQGDSITDAGRARDRLDPNDARAYGRGYPFLIASHLLNTHASDDLKIYNRGISGNKVPDLDARWEADCLALKPDLLSILIGVNDIWHKLNGRYDGTVETYEKGFAALLERTKEALPHVRLVICQPFVLRCGAVNDKWFPEFDQRKAAAERVAKKADATWVPFQEMFDKAVKRAKPERWASDGVHPTMAGHDLMAQTWLDVVKP
jgi:lysophospholipase L1-like esterase